MLTRVVLAGLLVLAAGAEAQGPPPGRGPGFFGPGPGFPGGARGGGRILGAEAGMPGRVVKNAPYSADMITESTQTLPDGNHIRQSATARVYRDSVGRTRREQSLRGLGSLAPNGNLPEVVFINDPVASVNIALNPTERSATRTPWMARGRAANGPMRPMERNVAEGSRRPHGPGPNQDVKTEPLGRQTIEGVQADGTRTTMTIPAGQMGNEQPIQIVREVWYSPDLQAVVLSKTSDPRFGETSFRMTNISRAEPVSTLFEVPAGFKVSEAAAGPARR